VLGGVSVRQIQGMAKLIVISSDERQEFELGEYNSIGRHPDNTIQVLDRIISKEHAAVQRLPDKRYLLRDLRSLTALVRGDRVTSASDDSDGSRWVDRLFVDREAKTTRSAGDHRPGLAEPHPLRIAASAGSQRSRSPTRRCSAATSTPAHRPRVAKAVGSGWISSACCRILDKAFRAGHADRAPSC
jgi:hypothetical protein